MGYIEHTISDDLMTWDHDSGVCKLIRIPREKIDEDSDEPDAWELIWIEARTNLRRFGVVLDPAYGRDEMIDRTGRDAIRAYTATAPAEAAEILADFAD